MAGFSPRRTQGGDSTGELRQILCGNSKTLTLGDALIMDVTNGGVDVTGAGSRLIGVIVGFVDRQGLPLNAQHHVGTGFVQSGNAGQIGSETVVTSSTNLTVDKVYAVVNVDPCQEYYNDANGDFTLPNSVGAYVDAVSTGDQIDAASKTFTDATSGQFIVTDWDPDHDGDASKVIVKIVEHKFHR